MLTGVIALYLKFLFKDTEVAILSKPLEAQEVFGFDPDLIPDKCWLNM